MNLLTTGLAYLFCNNDAKLTHQRDKNASRNHTLYVMYLYPLVWRDRLPVYRCITPTDGTNMRMTVTCITLAGYRNLIFESIRMKFGMNVTKHLLIMLTSFGDNCKILKVQNATSKK